jgi:hypothetical protein
LKPKPPPNWAGLDDGQANATVTTTAASAREREKLVLKRQIGVRSMVFLVDGLRWGNRIQNRRI